MKCNLVCLILSRVVRVNKLHHSNASNHHQPHLTRYDANSRPGQAAKNICDYAPGLPAKLRRTTAKSRQAQATSSYRLRRTCQYISALGAGAGLSGTQAVRGPCLLQRRNLPEVGGPTLFHPGHDTAHPLDEHRATQGRSQTPWRATKRQAMLGHAAPRHGMPWHSNFQRQRGGSPHSFAIIVRSLMRAQLHKKFRRQRH